MLQTKSVKSDKSSADEKAEKREAWHKIVVKILCWKDGVNSSNSISSTDKITPKEWTEYCTELLKINAQTSKDKIEQKIQETKKLISEHGGFSK